MTLGSACALELHGDMQAQLRGGSAIVINPSDFAALPLVPAEGAGQSGRQPEARQVGC